MTDDDFDPAECAGGLCPPGMLPAQYRHYDHCVWSRAPGELWWRRRRYVEAKDAASHLAELEASEPDAEFAVRRAGDGPPGEDD